MAFRRRRRMFRGRGGRRRYSRGRSRRARRPGVGRSRIGIRM